MSADDLKTLISVLALVASVVSLVLTRVNWRQSNRPVVSAYIAEDEIREGVALFNLSVSNSGTRPAAGVRIYIEPNELEKLIDPAAPREAKMKLAGCFGRDSMIPLLRNGETVTGGLGLSSRVESHTRQLLYGAEATATIRYTDLEGNHYESTQPLKVFAREGFTGWSWSSAA